jgi:hypothetical protein
MRMFMTFSGARARKLQGWPKSWANLRPHIGICSQNLGPTCNFWASPVTFALGGPRARRWEETPAGSGNYFHECYLKIGYDNPASSVTCDIPAGDGWCAEWVP